MIPKNPNQNQKIVELINSNEIASYKIRYLKRPCPIILEDFENVTINGIKIQLLKYAPAIKAPNNA